MKTLCANYKCLCSLLILLVLALNAYNSTNIKEEYFGADESCIDKNATNAQNKTNKLMVDIFGMWILTEIAFIDIDRGTMLSRNDLQRDEDFIGTIIEIEETQILFNDKSLNINQYLLKNIDLFHFMHESNVSKADIILFAEKYAYDIENVVYELDVPTLNVFFPGRIYFLNEEYGLVDISGTFIVIQKCDSDEIMNITLPKPQNPNPFYLYGEWEVIDYFCPRGQSTLDADSYLGSKLSYEKTYCILNDNLYSKPIYSHEINQYLLEPPSDIRLIFDMYGYNTENEFMNLLKAYELEDVETILLQSLILENKETPFGQFFYILNDKYILIFYEDVFFVAEKSTFYLQN